MIKHFQQIDFSTLSFEKVQVSSSESVILPRVDSKDCPFLQLPWVELAYYGIPKASKYFPTDKDRTFIQIPIHGELLQKFKELDNYLGSEEFKTKTASQSLGPAFLQNHLYQPIVKEAKYGEFIKVKLQTNYQSGDIETIIVKNGETMMDTDKLPEFEKHVRHKSKIKTMLKLSKLWQMNKKYGVTLKLIRIAVDDPQEDKVDLDALDFID
jgi:hypothetical protein